MISLEISSVILFWDQAIWKHNVWGINNNISKSGNGVAISLKICLHFLFISHYCWYEGFEGKLYPREDFIAGPESQSNPRDTTSSNTILQVSFVQKLDLLNGIKNTVAKML